jgi:hypothetical protein
MGYNSKSIKKDLDGKPIPQYFNPVEDEYEVLQGRNGANRVEIYGPDGNPISVDFATQTTLAAILNKIIAAPATEAKQTALAALIGEVQASPTANTLLARLKSLEDKIGTIDGVLDAIVDGSAPAATQLTGSNMELYGASINDRPAANTVAAGTTFTIVDENLDQNWISDGTNWKEV